MTPDDHAKSLHDRFTWESDGRFDSWQCLPPSGPVSGDCDDYAVTLLRSVSGSWFKFWLMVLTFQAMFWFVRDPRGQLHVTLWVRGHGYSDNWRDHFARIEDLHTRIFPVLLPIVALKMIFGKVDRT